MEKGKLYSRLTLFLIICLILVLFININKLRAANTSEDILDDYNSLLSDSKSALKEGDHSKAKMKLDKATLLLWNNAPLTAENVAFVKRRATFYGDIIPIGDKNYQPGDKLFLYLEPKNYLIETNQEGKYQINIVLDTKLIYEDGTIVFHNPEFLNFKKESSQPNREVKFDMYFNLTSGLKSGEYTIQNTLTDKLSDEKVVIESKFNFNN